MRRPLLAFLLLPLLFALPGAAGAEQATTWDFHGGNVPGSWEVTGLPKPEQHTEGLRIATGQAGRMIRQSDVRFPVDVIRLRLANAKPGQLSLLWHGRGGPRGELVQLPFGVNGGREEVIDLNVSNFPQWDPRADVIGLAFPAGTDVTLQAVEFLRWNLLEKLEEGWKGFWKFDTFRASSINFLWGPLLVTNPIGRAQLFLTQPPFGWSASRLFYAILVLAAFLLALHAKGRKRKTFSGYGTAYFCVFASLWLFFDARMGSELLSYAWDDYQTWRSPPFERSFRAYQDLFDLAEESASLLSPDERYAFVGPRGAPLLNIVRYITYPAIPLHDSEDYAAARSWLIFWRPDISVNQKGEIVSIDGEAFTKPGKIIRRFNEHSFFFRVNDPPPP